MHSGQGILHKQLMHHFETKFDSAFSNVFLLMHKDQMNTSHMVRRILDTYIKYAKKNPTVLAKNIALMYPVVLKDLSGRMASMFSINLPTDMKGLVFKWIGMDIEDYGFQLKPLSRKKINLLTSILFFLKFDKDCESIIPYKRPV